MGSASSAEDSSHGKRKVAVTHHFEKEVDVDRLEEWIEANIVEGRVQVTDLETGEQLYDDF